MFNLIKMYYKFTYLKPNYITCLKENRLLKLPYNFKWISLGVDINQETNQFKFIKLLYNFLTKTRKTKKYKKYNAFKYAIMRYRRFIKVNRWLKVNKFLINTSKLPIIKKPVINLNNDSIKLHDYIGLSDSYSYNNYPVNVLEYISQNYISRESKLHKQPVYWLILELFYHYENKFSIGSSYNSKLRNTIVREFDTIELIDKTTKTTLTHFNYNVNSTTSDNKKLYYYTIFNTYNQKTINWRITN